MRNLELARPGTLVWPFLALHAGVWTLVPSLVNPNLPLDTIEALAWGRAGQWGYDKHPPLSPWLAERTFALAPGQDWPLYLLSALCVAVALWAVWSLAEKLLGPRPALIAVLLLDGIYYHNFTSPEFNANVVLLPFWALSVLCLWRAVSGGGLMAWALFGAFGALGLLGKYFTAVLILAAGLFLVLDRESRALWRTPGPYLAAGVGLAVLAPHLFWMAANAFQTVGYALSRAQPTSEAALVQHLAYPAKFLLAQSLALAPAAAMLLALGRPRWRPAVPARERRFLLVVCLVPLLLVVLASAVFGLRLRSMWGTPLFLFWGVFALGMLQPRDWNLRRFAFAWLGLFALAPTAYAVLALAEPYVAGKGKRVHFPGRELAREVEAQWRARVDAPLGIVIGSEWVAGNVSDYSAARPQVYIEAKLERAPWLDDARVRVEGAAVVWDLQPDAEDDEAPFNLGSRFSCLEPRPPIALAWDTGADLPPLRIGLALILPAAMCEKP